MPLISTTDAAKRIGVSVRRVQAMITAGQLPARKIGGSYVIDTRHLSRLYDRRPGRPPAQ